MGTQDYYRNGGAEGNKKYSGWGRTRLYVVFSGKVLPFLGASAEVCIKNYSKSMRDDFIGMAPRKRIKSLICSDWDAL